jgi:exodeoxyribonuclease V alpha subunit
MKKEILDHLIQMDFISGLDIQFGRLMERLAGGEAPELFLAAALASKYQREGHICLDLSSVAGKPLPDDGVGALFYPELKEWLEAIRKSSVVGRPGEYRPLVLEGTRLYLYRYWDYEKKLADILKRRTGGADLKVNLPLLKEGLDRLFPLNDPKETDWQKVAAYTSVLKKFCVISGGPGTGKTFTVAKILALLLEQAGGERLKIALAAPTGKAAARLQDAIKSAKGGLNCTPQIKAAIPEEASTLHRLLKRFPDSPYFRHDAQNPLPADVVVVDEASMVALALISKLAQAVPPGARLILLGDKDQLASVEAGAVLGDICDTGNEHGFSLRFREAYHQLTGERIEAGAESEKPDIRDSVVQLKKSFRFGASSGIGAVSRAINEGDGVRAGTFMKDEGYPDIQWRDLPRPDGLLRALKGRITGEFAGYLKATDPAETFSLFNRFRILCALREGPYGVLGINRLVESILRKEGLIRRDGPWYPGRPILITTNDYTLGLFNGDVGITLPHPEDPKQLRVFFPLSEKEFRRIPPLRLPEHETVFAMTVHKSQGSEFDRVLLFLPDRAVPVLTRELIYTGITRGKEKVEVWGSEEVFQEAISHRIERASGLRDALWGRDL